MSPILQHVSHGVGLSLRLCVFVYNPETGIMGIGGTLDKIASSKLNTRLATAWTSRHAPIDSHTIGLKYMVHM